MDITRRPRIRSRYIFPYYGGQTATTVNQTATAGRVYGSQFGVEAIATIDRLIYTVGTTSAGNVTAGIYRLATIDTMTGATLVVQSSSTAQASANTAQLMTIANTTLTPGLYYVVFEFSDGTATFVRHANAQQAVGLTSFFDQTYGTLPSTAPTATEDNTSLAIPAARLRVVQTV